MGTKHSAQGSQELDLLMNLTAEYATVLSSYILKSGKDTVPNVKAADALVVPFVNAKFKSEQAA
jgi:hypothetical protein